MLNCVLCGGNAVVWIQIVQVEAVSVNAASSRYNQHLLNVRYPHSQSGKISAQCWTLDSYIEQLLAWLTFARSFQIIFGLLNNTCQSALQGGEY